ncbi:hypothetical protein Cni_G06658 [Canna indica]|uniref:Uncharacterized protein n=1 Tax=Canna indica TaxID=4628 RepID=A0AAQ3Q472_9LILI|nr:hypothetical protein Cni_G06658 [Canna indica]
MRLNESSRMIVTRKEIIKEDVMDVSMEDKVEMKQKGKVNIYECDSEKKIELKKDRYAGNGKVWKPKEKGKKSLDTIQDEKQTNSMEALQRIDIVFETKTDQTLDKKNTDGEDEGEKRMEELSKKLSESFEKNLNNKFAKEDYMEEGIDPELSRLTVKTGTKERRGSNIMSKLVNIPVGYKQLKLKKRRFSKETNAIGDEGDPGSKNGEEVESSTLI